MSTSPPTPTTDTRSTASLPRHMWLLHRVRFWERLDCGFRKPEMAIPHVRPTTRTPGGGEGVGYAVRLLLLSRWIPTSAPSPPPPPPPRPSAMATTHMWSRRFKSSEGVPLPPSFPSPSPSPCVPNILSHGASCHSIVLLLLLRSCRSRGRFGIRPQGIGCTASSGGQRKERRRRRRRKRVLLASERGGGTSFPARNASL